MALQNYTVAVGNLIDDGAGRNYAVDEPVYIKTTGGALAPIFRDEAGTSPIIQDGIANLTNQFGEFTFYVESGEYIIESAGNERSATIAGSDYFNNQIEIAVNQIVEDTAESRGFRVAGSFVDGFDYELPNDVGTNTGGTAWIYVGSDPLPVTVPPGTDPTASSDYLQVTFNDVNALTGVDQHNQFDNFYNRSVNLSEAISDDAEVGTNYVIRDLSFANYLVVDSSDTGGFYIATMSSGRKLRLNQNSAKATQIGCKDGQDGTVPINECLALGISIELDIDILGRGIELNVDNTSLWANEYRQVKNPDGLNGVSIITVNAEGCLLKNIFAHGNGDNDPGGSIGDASLRGIDIYGRNNKAVNCIAFKCGKRLTSGDQGGTNQVGVGFGGFSDDESKPNKFINCIGDANGNYGFNPRGNVYIEGGSASDNGTNGIGNRFCENFHVKDFYIGVQYQGNPDTSSSGLYLDTETPTSPDYQKLSRNSSFTNMVIEAQEAFSITSSFYTGMLFENVKCKGKVLIQSSEPQVAPDLGTIGVITLKDFTAEGDFNMFNVQCAKMERVRLLSTNSLGTYIDNSGEVNAEDLEVSASLARFIRIDSFNFTKLKSSNTVELATIPKLNGVVDMDGVTPVSDQVAVNISGTKGRLTGRIANYGFPIENSGGNSNVDLSGFEFDSCGAADGSKINACINFVNTKGYVLNNLKFTNCTGRALYATGATDFTSIGGNVKDDCSCSLTIEGSSNEFILQGWSFKGTGTFRVFQGTSMDGGQVVGNYIASSATISARPAGETRFQGGVLEVWNGTAWAVV